MNWLPPGPALLFCPADRPERYGKAAASADMVLLDLEDGVSPANKPAARVELQRTLLDPTRTIVRLNPANTADHIFDLEALAETPYDTVMLAKTESADQVAALASLRVVALCETPRGILDADAIARCHSTIALMWGAEDLVASLGGRSSRRDDGTYRDVSRNARSHVLLAARANHKSAIDAVHLDIFDVTGLEHEASDAAASGFAATACIHPTQVEIVRAAYSPSETDIAWARRVLVAADKASGVFRFEDQMVDAPVLRQAQKILDRAEAPPDLPGGS